MDCPSKRRLPPPTGVAPEASLRSADPIGGRLQSPLAAEEVSWLAIRQPGVIKLLEQRLWAPDGDAFAAALEMVCRLLGEIGIDAGLPLPRLDHRVLDAGVAAVAGRSCDPHLESWVRDQLAGLPVVLSAHEEDEVVAVIAAVVWAAAEVRGGAAPERDPAGSSSGSSGSAVADDLLV